MLLLDSFANNSDAASLMFGNTSKVIQSPSRNYTDVSFLRLVTPDLERAQSFVGTFDVAELKDST